MSGQIANSSCRQDLIRAEAHPCAHMVWWRRRWGAGGAGGRRRWRRCLLATAPRKSHAARPCGSRHPLQPLPHHVSGRAGPAIVRRSGPWIAAAKWAAFNMRLQHAGSAISRAAPAQRSGGLTPLRSPSLACCHCAIAAADCSAICSRSALSASAGVC